MDKRKHEHVTQAKISNLKIRVLGKNNLLLQSRFNSSAQSLCDLDEDKIERGEEKKNKNNAC